MDKRLEKILALVESNPKDEEHFGLRVIEIIKRSEALWDSTNKYELLREFLAGLIGNNEAEIKHADKFTPIVYHPNYSASRRFENEVASKLLKELLKI